MKQNTIPSYFDYGRGRSGASSNSTQYGRVSNRDKVPGREIFPNRDPRMVYRNIMKKEQQQFKAMAPDNSGMDVDFSSQSSTQLFPSSQSSHSYPMNSSESNDNPWMQDWLENKYQGPSMYKKQQKNYHRPPNRHSSDNIQDMHRYLNEFKNRSKKSEERETIATILTLVRECCEETKLAVNSSCEKCEGQVSRRLDHTLKKFQGLSKGLQDLSAQFKSREEYEDKIRDLELQLQEKTTDNENLRRELNEAREIGNSNMLEKLSGAIDQGQRMQSDKIEELVSNTNKIQSILDKPKPITAEMWSQYSPRFGKPPIDSRSSVSANLPPSISRDSHVATTSNAAGTYISDVQNYPPTNHDGRHNSGVHTVVRAHQDIALSPALHGPRYLSPRAILKLSECLPYGMQHCLTPQRSVQRFEMADAKKFSPVAAIKPFFRGSSSDNHGHHNVPTCVSNASYQILAQQQRESWYARNTRSANILTTMRYDSKRNENFRTPSLVHRNASNSSVAKRKRELGGSPLKRTRTQQSAEGQSQTVLSVVDDKSDSLAICTPDETFKQEILSPTASSLRIRRCPLYQKAWPEVTESDGDSTDNDSVIIFDSPGDKENKEPLNDVVDLLEASG